MEKLEWNNDYSQQFLERDYLLPGQSLEDRLRLIAAKAEFILGFDGFAEKFLGYISKGWYSLSTPIWTNFATSRGLPISCFGSFIGDTIESILYTQAEVGMMTKLGGGTAAYFGALRPRGAPITDNGHSSGSVHFMQMFETMINIVSQGSTRRGNFAAYLDIEHADIAEFLSIRSEGSPLQNISFGVCVSDAFMNGVIEGDALKRQIWAKVLESRANTGYPYIVFTDTANNNTVDVYKDRKMRIYGSNLCSEIMLPTNKNESFVCDLSSMNILHYDDWKDTDAVETLVYFLDAVMSEFIGMARGVDFLARAVKFAERHRALGLGWVGWHSFLQSKGIPFESMEAKLYNGQIAKLIQQRAHDASETLAQRLGEPEYLKGYGRRNTTLTAIAPTKSSSFILGQVSEAVEPHRSNFYIKDLQKGKFTIKNPFLVARLAELGHDTPAVWDSILKAGGSVQHLDWLTDIDRGVFRTMAEISPKEIVIQAGQRQRYLDQSQSLNLLISPEVPIRDVNALIIEAWKLGVKSLYYQFGVNAAQKFSRDILHCVSCE